jgi:hypothetical protein
MVHNIYLKKKEFCHMKKVNIAISLMMVFMASSAYAGPGGSKMFEEVCNNTTKNFNYIPKNLYVKKGSYFMVRNFSTKGFKPEKQVSLNFQYDNIPNQKIRFLDKSHERYVKRQQLSKSSNEKDIISKEEKDDHTIIVDLKKK